MIFLLDTTAFSDLMREDVSTRNKLATLGPDDRVAICSIVRGEVRYGIERLPPGARRDALEAKSLRLFAVLACEPVSTTAGDHYGRIKAISQSKGLSLDENDLWIAATAAATGATLVSRDSDFRRLDGLNLVDWSR
jgi:predicted nucleic acid-binding protein